MRTYKFPIVRLEPNQIFAFGSNTEGRHGLGAALWALRNAGAKYGKPKGLQGQSYAIITKDLTKKVHPSVSFQYIIDQISQLYLYSEENAQLDFVVSYKGEGEYLNGFSPEAMASAFSVIPEIREKIPTNIIFEEKFSKLVKAN